MTDRLATAVDNSQSWRREARCAEGVDPEIFYPHPAEAWIAYRAIAVCLQCPVRRQCGDHALDTGERRGIWGGLTPETRRAILRRRTAAAALRAGAAS